VGQLKPPYWANLECQNQAAPKKAAAKKEAPPKKEKAPAKKKVPTPIKPAKAAVKKAQPKSTLESAENAIAA
jgi:hypothetical protein